MANQVSAKRLQIVKTNARIVATVSVAAFVVVFSLVATKTLISQASYQNRVISAKRKAVEQLKADKAATTELKKAYNAFTGTTQNVLGGNPAGTGAQDGTNTKIVLDALPSSYDFPGLTTSLETLLGSQNVKITSLGGTDDEVAQGGNQTSTSPQPVPIPFAFVIGGSYKDVQDVVSAFGKSIRPMQIQTLDMEGTEAKMTLTVNAQTFYQPAKSLNINKQVVK